ncbi:MAG: 3-deoxy-7-phosphoheptulonate synthase [Pseudomonadota bacterium]
MSFQRLNEILHPEEIRSAIPLPNELKKIKQLRDGIIKDIFEGKSSKFLLVIGPCSADNEDSVCAYISRLAALQEKVCDSLILIPRIYTNKPRTTGTGYKGMVHQPDPHKEPNIAEGIKAIRRMHIRSLRESHLSAADEMLYPGNAPYLEDILSYNAIGARSVENQQHRLTASGLDVPVGMKNPTSGDLQVMLNAVYAAQQSHIFVHNSWEVKTTGNPYAHAILRGAVDPYGNCIPNYHYENLIKAAEDYLERNLTNPLIIVDTNHANSNKHFEQQPRIAFEVMQSRRNSPVLRKIVRGLMIESYLVEGSQKIGGNVYGKSITDPCLGWEETEDCVKRLADMV